MPLPTEPVGSLPRPSRLEAAYEARERGAIGADQLRAEQEAAAADSIRRLEGAGESVVSAGEHREASLVSYPLSPDPGTGTLAANLSPEGQPYGVFGEAHHRLLPRLVSGPFRYATFAHRFVERNVGIASVPFKQAVIAPSMLMLLYPVDGEIEGYSRDQFLADLCEEAERDIRGCFQAGAARVSIDFTEARIAHENESRNPWTGRDMLGDLIEINNRVIDRFGPEERNRLGVHLCLGRTVSSERRLRQRVLTRLFELNAGYFLLPFASQDDEAEVLRLCAENRRENAGGIPQVCFVGVVDPFRTAGETPDEIRDMLLRAAETIPADRLGATDDCGFAALGLASEPVVDRDRARDLAIEKVANRVRGAAMASAALGL